MKEKILTIAIPIYNTEKYIEKCIDSLLECEKEILEKLDIIIVNDGSTDSSLEKVQKYNEKFPNSISVINKENGGHGSTINKALGLSKAKYFCVLDSDDWYNGNALTIIIEKLEENSKLDALFYNHVNEIVYKNKSVVNSKKDIFKKINSELDLNRVSVRRYNTVGMPNIIYRTELLRNIDLRIMEKTFYVDTEYVVYPLSKVKRAMYIDVNLYHYYIGRPNQSICRASAIKHYKDREKVMLAIVDYFDKIEKKELNMFARKMWKYKILNILDDCIEIIIRENKDIKGNLDKLDNKLKKYKNIDGINSIYLIYGRIFNYNSFFIVLLYRIKSVRLKIKGAGKKILNYYRNMIGKERV